MHWADNFSVPWGDPQRADYHNVTGIPISIFDGEDRRAGTRGDVQGTFLWFEETLANRLAVPTDVAVNIDAVQLNESTFEVTTSATMDADGIAKDVALFVVEALDHWPTTDDFWRNTLRQPISTGVQRSLSPGQIVDVTDSVTLDITSLDRFDDVKLIAWAESTTTGEVLNASQIWLSQLDIATADLGDFNADGVFNLDDIDALVDAITTLDGNPSVDVFDINGDGSITQNDIGVWLETAATANGLSAPYRPGDANLDGTIDAQDLNAVGRNWQAESNSWQGGDFNADRRVDALDLNAVGQGWLSTVAQAAPIESVPEPSGHMPTLLGMAAVLTIRRRARSRTLVEVPKRTPHR